LFLHADTRLPPHADTLIREGLALSRRAWGRFDVSIEGRHPLLPVVAAFMNTRSRLTGIATGDQAIFVTRDAFAAAGGYPGIALMEDIELARRLKRISRPLCLRARVTTSGRRWASRGVLRTIVLMWRLRLAYFLGAKPEELARRYD
jgi:rSAM/selenodomain-associated transferase 2